MKKPNILFFFTDQLRFDAIAAHGNPVIRTPNIDRLVQNGTTFASTYSPSPVCVAARCCLHYGQYPVHTGCYANAPMPMDNRPSYVARLTEAGYRTHAIGKCHFHPDTYSLRGYETREVQEEGGCRKEDLDRNPYIKLLVERGFGYAIEPFGVRSDMYYIPQPSRLPQELHPSQWVGDRSVAFLKEQAQNDPDRPWYLFSSFIHPHPPFAPPSPWHTLYRAVDMPLPTMPDGYESLQMFVNLCQNRYKYRDRGLDMNLIRMMKAYYYACVSFVDYQVGRILHALEETGQADNTLIVFAADHGEMLGDYGCFGKRSMHNAAARVPLILCGGDFTGGHVCRTPTSLVDVAPTLMDVAGADASGMLLDGVNLRDIQNGTSDRQGVFSMHSALGEINNFSGRDTTRSLPDAESRWFACMDMMYAETDTKYVYSAADNREFLFDEAHDPHETRNAVSDPACADTLGRMRKNLIAFLHESGIHCLDDETQADRLRPLIHPKKPDNPDAGLIRQDYRPAWFDFDVLRDYLPET